MRSNADVLILAGALALGGCSSAWWNDPPATPVDAAQPLAAPTPDSDAPPGQSDWSSNGAAYPSPQPTPTYRAPRPAPVPTGEPEDGPPPPRMPPVRYDGVGYAVWSSDAGTVAAAHPTLPFGSFAEVTSIDTGKTIIVPITARSRPGREIELSGAAAQELGLGQGGGQAGVRVRAANPTGGDLAAFKAGRPAPARPDTPPVLLNALRRKLAGTSGQIGTPRPEPETRQPTPPMPASARRPVTPVTRAPAPRPAATAPKAGPGYYVQLAALSDAARARSVAQSVGGTVSSGEGLHRVRFGPFEDLKTAQAARDDIARRGYGDARIVRQD